MKKYLALLLGVLFVLGFAATSFAIHAEIPSETQAVVAKGKTQITIGGEIRARGEYQEVDFNTDTPGKAFYDSRVRLSVDAQVTPNTQGFIQVEAGNGEAKDNFTWGGQGDSGATGIYGKTFLKDIGRNPNVGNAKQGQFNLLQAWILYKGSGLLGVPAGVKVGHMPLALGNKLFFAHDKFGDDAIVFFVDPTKELHVGLLTAKFREGTQNVSDDADAYVGLFTYKGQGFNLSGDVTYVDDRSPADDENIHFWNFGLRGDAKVDPVTLRADVELQSGKVTNTPIKFRGYAILLGADAKMSGIKLTAEFAYGSGDKPDTDKLESFVTSLGADPHFTYVYEYRTKNACGIANGGLCNTWYIKLGAAGDITKEISASLNAYLLRAAKTSNGVDKEIGFELDPKIVYKIDRNLSYWVEGGYLFAGDFWKGGNPDAKVDDAYAIRHGIMLSF